MRRETDRENKRWNQRDLKYIEKKSKYEIFAIFDMVVTFNKLKRREKLCKLYQQNSAQANIKD